MLVPAQNSRRNQLNQSLEELLTVVVVVGATVVVTGACVVVVTAGAAVVTVVDPATVTTEIALPISFPVLV